MQRLLIPPHHPRLIIIARYAIMGYMYFKSKHFDDKRDWCGRSVGADVVEWQNQLHQIVAMPPYGSSSRWGCRPSEEFDCVSTCLIFSPRLNEDSSALEHIIRPPSTQRNGSLDPNQFSSNLFSTALTWTSSAGHSCFTSGGLHLKSPQSVLF